MKRQIRATVPPPCPERVRSRAERILHSLGFVLLLGGCGAAQGMTPAALARALSPDDGYLPQCTIQIVKDAAEHAGAASGDSKDDVYAQQARCTIKVLTDALGKNSELVDGVLFGDVPLFSALDKAGKDVPSMISVMRQLQGCVNPPVVAPPPAYGNKVM